MISTRMLVGMETRKSLIIQRYARHESVAACAAAAFRGMPEQRNDAHTDPVSPGGVHKPAVYVFIILVRARESGQRISTRSHTNEPVLPAIVSFTAFPSLCRQALRISATYVSTQILKYAIIAGRLAYLDIWLGEISAY
jgi:hypothetical protein